MKALFQDPYEILGVSEDATKKQIQRAYRRLAKRFHPDLNPDKPDAEEKFKKIQWAYEILTATKELKDVHLRGQKEPRPFSEEADPFLNFFHAIRSYYSKRKE